MAVQRAEQHLRHWTRHRGALLELVERLPAAAASFRPWDGAMTTAVLLAHVARSVDRTIRAVERGSFQGPPPGGSVPPATIEEAGTLLRSLTEEDTALLGGLSDAQFDARLEFPPPRPALPAVAALAMALDHEIHHKGQLWVYARMCGVEPPSFVRRG